MIKIQIFMTCNTNYKIKSRINSYLTTAVAFGRYFNSIAKQISRIPRYDLFTTF